MCLDIYNGGADDGQPYLKPCGDFSGQAWRLTKTSDAPQRADVGDTVTFRFPRHRDDPVDFCWSWATKDCGQRVADWWCKKQRFRGTADFKAGRAQGRTAFLGSKENCNDPGCTGFESLTCRGKLSSGVQGRKQVFANPIVSTERRLDFCLEFGKNCGAPVAEAFCKAEGFSRWVYFEGDEPGDPAKRTITLGSKQKCNGEGCVAMNIITCDD